MKSAYILYWATARAELKLNYTSCQLSNLNLLAVAVLWLLMLWPAWEE